MKRLLRRLVQCHAVIVPALALALAGCGTPQDPVNPDHPWTPPGAEAGLTEPLQPVLQAENPTNPTPAIPLLGPTGSELRVGDLLRVTFSDITPLPPPHEVRVGGDGTITLPFNERVAATGKTVRQLEEAIRAAYVPKYYTVLTVTVTTAELFYFVGGEVKLPNRQVYLGTLTVTRAIDTAGGFTDYARRSRIELRRANGESIRVNYDKAIKNRNLDPAVHPGDQVFVPKRGPFY